MRANQPKTRKPSQGNPIIVGTVGLVLLALIGIVLQFTKSEQQSEIPGAPRQTKPPEAVNVEDLAEKRKQQQKLAQQREKAETDALARKQLEDSNRQKERIRQQTRATLIAEAAKDIQQLRLTSPKGNNAVEKYQHVLDLDPQN